MRDSIAIDAREAKELGGSVNTGVAAQLAYNNIVGSSDAEIMQA